MIRRRHFLQFAGSTLTTFGMSNLNIFQQGDRYAQVLAQNTPRKLALLVGINKYPENKRYQDLQGCVTDVDLQEELLIHRFGFNKNDILRLTTDESANKQPTRSNILTAFEEHLIKQAKPSDVVVFHFSGHGSQLIDPNPVQLCPNKQFNADSNSTIVIADQAQKGLAPDIMGRTLFLMMSALPTENVSFVLDSCHSGGGTRGNYRIRSVPGDNLKPSPEEIAYQQRWMKQLQISPEELAKRRCAAVRKGVVLAAVQREEEALDATFYGFHAGAFTYVLTQYLWQQTDNVGSAIAQINSGLQARNIVQKSLADGNQTQPVYFINQKLPPADAVIIKAEGKQATLWLGGIDSQSLETFGKGATFTIVDNNRQTSAQLKLESRRGLIAEARLQTGEKIPSLQPGMLLQESSRVVPADLKLSIGLDPSIAEDTSAAKQALSQINRIEAVPAQSPNQPYSTKIQYILSRMTANYRQQLQQQKIANLPTVGSIGLFTEGLELVPQSFGKLGETVQVAVSRLEPILKSFLAAEIIKKTLNATSSKLDVEVSMNLVDQPNQFLAKVSTGRTRNNSSTAKQIYSHKLPLDRLFQFRVTNHERETIHLITLLIDSSGELIVVFPYQWPATDQSTLLQPDETRIIGDPQQLKLKAIEKGTGQALVIVSRSSLQRALKSLAALASELNRDRGAVELTEPVDVIGDLLDDLSSDRGGNNVSQDKIVNTSETATLAIPFEVV